MEDNRHDCRDHCTWCHPTTPTNPPAKHPTPRVKIDPQECGTLGVSGEGAFDYFKAFTGGVPSWCDEAKEYLSLQEHTALLQEERARGWEEGYRDGLLRAEQMLDEKLAARSPGDAEKGENDR